MLGLSEPNFRVAKDWNEPLLPQAAGRVPVKGKLTTDRTDRTGKLPGWAHDAGNDPANIVRGISLTLVSV